MDFVHRPDRPDGHGGQSRSVAGIYPRNVPTSGKAHAASAGWSLGRILTDSETRRGPVILPLLGASHQVGALAWEPEGK